MTALVVDSNAITTLESPNAVPDVVAIRVDDGHDTRFVVYTTRPRLAQLAILGPVASDEEHRPLFEAVVSGDSVDLAIVVRNGDGCGSHVVRVDSHRIDASRRRATRVATLERSAPASGALPTSPTTTERAGFAAIGTAFTAAGLTTTGVDRLVDSDAATTFGEPSHAARIVARFTLAPLRTRGLRIALRGGANSQGTFVIALGDERFTVTPTSDAFELRFPEPRDARCVAVEWPEENPSSLAEIGFIPDLDSDEARANQLVIELASEGTRADSAIEALSMIPDAAVETLVSAYADALPAERRRILRAAELLSTREPDALRLFVVALEGEDEGLRDYALDRCAAMGTRGLRVLSTAVRRGRGDLARDFAERAPFASLDPILARLGQAEVAERRDLHEALAVAARRDEARVRPALRAYVESDADVHARALVLDVLRATGDSEGIAAALDLWWTTTPSTDEVDVELRWVEAIGAISVAARTDAMRTHLDAALRSDAWMVRAAAVDAAALDPSRIEAIRTTLDDDVPRVRVAAIRALASDDGSRRRIAELSRNDDWPHVRLAALTVIAPMDGTDAIVRDAMTERSTRVRIGLFADLAARGDRRFIEDAIGVIERGRAPSSVLVAAIRYLEALCATEGESVLVAQVDLALREDSEGHRATASAAARALERLGSPDGVASARRFVDPTRSGGTPPPRCGGPVTNH